ncbi:MAG: L,D-transpeptidase [Proteobacteria bacterium]|nr:MAG: L,D-transpeptidase [Pseudomonadota bacterium]
MARVASKKDQGSAVVTSTHHFVLRTATAGATILLVGALAAPADAFFSDLPQGMRQDSRPAVNPPTDRSKTARPARPRAPAAARLKPPALTKASPGTPAGELADKAQGGPLQIIISIDKQQLTLYAGGEAIAHSRVSTGQRGHATPTGVFSIIEKDRWHRSNLYDSAPMWFMQRITWSGVALHQGVVPNYPASHGCVRLPEAFARQLWTTTKLGARVIIARGEVAPVEISHPHLFVPKPASARGPVVSQIESLKAAQQAWTFADLASKAPLVGASLTDVPAFGAPNAEPPVDAVKPATRPLKAGPVSVFISRREGKLFVRKGFEPVFDVPVTIENADQPLGTHVFTAIAQRADNASMRWTVVSMAPSGPRAADALDRITIPQAALDQINELVSTGASLIISDEGLGRETGKGTDFIVLTR